MTERTVCTRYLPGVITAGVNGDGSGLPLKPVPDFQQRRKDTAAGHGLDRGRCAVGVLTPRAACWKLLSYVAELWPGFIICLRPGASRGGPPPKN